MRGPAVQPIVIAAGGTGGHFFPAEALAAELIARGHRVVLMTDARSGGLASPVFAGREQYVLRGAGIAGRGAWRGVKAVGAMAAGVVQARGILARLGAGCVVGFGGYPCVAPVLAAGLLRRRPVGDPARAERGAGAGEPVPGAAGGRAGAGVRADRACAGRDADRGDRQSGAAGDRRAGADGLRRRRPTGSGCWCWADRWARGCSAMWCRRRCVPCRRRCGRGSRSCSRRGRRIWSGCGRPMPRTGSPRSCRRSSPMWRRGWSAAHLVIARAGASTVAELAVAGRPAILVPLPGAIDDHQSANARALAQAGGAWVVPQAAVHARRC